MICLTYEDLLQIAQEKKLIVTEKAFKSKSKGLIKGNKIGISTALETDAERACILAEEIAHYETNCGDILDQTKVENQKEELRARRYAIQMLLPLSRLVEAYEAGKRNRYETAEFLDVTEPFLASAIEAYANLYGLCHREGKYLIYFQPMRIIRMV